MAGKLDVSLVLKATDSGFKSTLDGAERELGQLDTAADKVGRSIKRSLENATRGPGLARQLSGWRTSWNRASGSIKQGIGGIGLQMQDVAVSLQSGASPFTVLLQQGTQIASAFGPTGAIAATIGAGALLAIDSLVNLSDDGFAVAEQAVKDLEAALEEANRTLGEGASEAEKIVEAYQGLSGTTQGLGVIKIADDIINLRHETEDARAAFQGLVGDIELAARTRAGLGLSSTGRAGVLGGLGGEITLAEAQGLQSAVARFRGGALTQVQFIGEVQRVLAGATEEARAFARELIAVADKAETTRVSLGELAKAGKGVADLAQQGGVHLRNLGGSLDQVGQKVKQNEGAWAAWYDALVGQSYIPDAVTESEIWFDRLRAHMTSTTREATEGVADAFIGLDRQVSGTLARMITSNRLALQDFADFGLDIANQVLSGLIQVGIQTGLNLAFSPSSGAGAGGGGGGTGAMLAEMKHAGGIVGEGGPRRLVDALLFAGAPRFHRGGTVLHAGEVPIIAKRGERVIPAGQAVAAPVTVNVYNETGSEVQTKQRRGPRGENIVDLIIRQNVNAMMMGNFDGPMASRFGLRPGRPG